VRDLEHILSALSVIRAQVHLCINQHTTFEVPSFTDFKYITGAKFKKTGDVILTTPIGVVCHPKASIFDIL